MSAIVYMLCITIYTHNSLIVIYVIMINYHIYMARIHMYCATHPCCVCTPPLLTYPSDVPLIALCFWQPLVTHFLLYTLSIVLVHPHVYALMLGDQYPGCVCIYPCISRSYLTIYCCCCVCTFNYMVHSCATTSLHAVFTVMSLFGIYLAELCLYNPSTVTRIIVTL